MADLGRSGAKTSTLDRDVATYLGAQLAAILSPRKGQAKPEEPPPKPEPKKPDPPPPKKKGGIEIEEIPDVDDDQEEYNPGDEEADPFQNVHAIESCENLFFGDTEVRQCVFAEGEIQIPAVVDLSEEENEFLQTWDDEGVEHLELGEDALSDRLDEVVEFIAKHKEGGPVLVFDGKKMLRSAALCVMYMMQGDGKSITESVEAIQEDLDPIEHHIWRSKKIKGWLKAKAAALDLDDDDDGQVFAARENAIKAADKFGPK